MNYIEILPLLSGFQIGCLLISRGRYILEANETAEQMLHGTLRGRLLDEAAPGLDELQKPGQYYNAAFMEYLAPAPSPKDIELPDGTRLLCFREAKNEVTNHMLETIVNLIPEPVVLTDEKQRIILINDATMRMESLMQQDVVGRDINEVYPSPSTFTEDGEVPQLTVPLVLSSHQPIINARQSYQTCQGKRLDIMCSSYPVWKDDRILGVFCVTADSARIEALSRQIIDLQEKLLGDSHGKRSKKARKGPLTAQYTFRDLIYQSAVMDALIRKCRMSAKSDSPIMLYGETGTGKELIAQSIHNASRRANGPFLAINCAAIPENLLESLLFGTEKGAYTGAECRPGLFEQADGGTLLLDELNSMSIALQAKLLRVLQDGVVRRVGGTEEIRVDVRVLSNVNVPPYQAIAEKKMREDLYYRLGVVNISIPPLRERKEDIPILARTFFLAMNEKLQKSVCGVNAETLAIFAQYDWPGNIRELQHCIEHAMNLLPDEETMICPQYLPERILNRYQTYAGGRFSGGLEDILANVERGILSGALAENRGNISKAARQLGISRQNLQHRIKRCGLQAETFHAPERTVNPDV